MMEKRGADGRLLHGAGVKRSEEWWKGLHGLMVGKGLVELKSMQVRAARGYDDTCVLPFAGLCCCVLWVGGRA